MIEYVFNNICIGNRFDARNLDALHNHGIGAIINCAAEIPVATRRLISYLHLYLEPEKPITPQIACLVSRFMLQHHNHRILVHCAVGMERSPSIVILILMLMGLPYETAFEICKIRRREVKIRIYPEVEKSLRALFE